jgi:hypothetical protein
MDDVLMAAKFIASTRSTMEMTVRFSGLEAASNQEIRSFYH